ncbi:MAG TPA: hypothetical protein VIP11_04600 [Gemmatimonadaceae bacterium]
MTDFSVQDADVPTLTAAAERFLGSQPWCARVQSVTPVFAIAGVIGVFRCTLIPRSPDADVTVWVVVGDLPPAYLVHEPGDSWQDALSGYVTEMTHWVDAIRSDVVPNENIIPVNAMPTRKSADLLASRLDFIRTRLVDVDPDSVESDV